MKVAAPEGQTWRVSRRWLPRRRRRWTRDDIRLPHAIDVDDPVAGLVFFLVFLLILAVAPVVLLALLVAVEFVVLLALLPFAVLARVLFGRHWHVELRRDWTPWHEEEAGDWQAAGLRIHDLAAGVRRGEIPVRTLGKESSA